MWAYEVSCLWLNGDVWSHTIIFMCCQVHSLCPPFFFLENHPLCPKPYLSSHSGNYSNEPPHLFYSTTWSVWPNVHVILCDVATQGVSSFQVQHLWTSKSVFENVLIISSTAPCRALNQAASVQAEPLHTRRPPALALAAAPTPERIQLQINSQK